jgi:hypothetical protein
VQRQVAPAVPDDDMDSQIHPGANVWWVRAARNYDPPWAVLGAIPFAALLVFAAVSLRRTLADGRRADAAAA